ncbi:uncharacterized protein [Palaemon carinicauda]|uniref:uncharacterized protein n=1 Tax=Palaemon carinicauda TaxID=392227 RepID=UPI0035B694E2
MRNNYQRRHRVSPASPRSLPGISIASSEGFAVEYSEEGSPSHTYSLIMKGLILFFIVAVAIARSEASVLHYTHPYGFPHLQNLASPLTYSNRFPLTYGHDLPLTYSNRFPLAYNQGLGYPFGPYYYPRSVAAAEH